MCPAKLGELTPGEYLAMLNGYKWRREQESKDRIELAWMIAILSRQRKVPPLERLLKPDGAQQAIKTTDERRQEYEDLKERLGV